MSNLEKHIASLEAKASQQHASLSKSLKIWCVVYVILIIAVLTYTTYALKIIKETTSPETMAKVVSSYLMDEIPAQRKQLVSDLNSQADTVATQSVDFVIAAIPKIEGELQGTLEQSTDLLITEMRNEVMPAFSEFIKQDAAKINEALKEMDNEEAARGIAMMFVEVIDDELNSYVNTHLVFDLENLQKDLQRLVRGKDLSREEEAKRRVLLYWALLQDKVETGESPIQALLKKVNARYRLFNSEEIKQFETQMVDPEVKGAAELAE